MLQTKAAPVKSKQIQFKLKLLQYKPEQNYDSYIVREAFKWKKPEQFSFFYQTGGWWYDQAHISMSVESSHKAVQEQHTCDDPWTRLLYSEQISKLKMFQILTKNIPWKKPEMYQTSLHQVVTDEIVSDEDYIVFARITA